MKHLALSLMGFIQEVWKILRWVYGWFTGDANCHHEDTLKNFEVSASYSLCLQRIDAPEKQARSPPIRDVAAHADGA